MLSHLTYVKTKEFLKMKGAGRKIEGNQCSMFNVQMERGPNNPTRGQMHQREVTHVRHHQRSMGQHVVTQTNNNVSLKQKSKLGSCQQNLGNLCDLFGNYPP